MARRIPEDELVALVTSCSAVAASPTTSGPTPASGSPAPRRARLVQILDEAEELPPPLPLPPVRR